MTRIPGSTLSFTSVIAIEVEKARKAQGLSRPEFVARLGYGNIGRGCRRYMDFLEGNIAQQFILENLHKACGVDRPLVLLWLEQSLNSIAMARLRTFRPHGIIKTERERPSPIFVAAFTGSADRKHVAFDFGAGAPSFVDQALAAIQRQVGEGGTIPAFGKPTGIIINLTPFYARHYDLEGNFIEEADRAFHLGTTTTTIGNKAANMAKILA